MTEEEKAAQAAAQAAEEAKAKAEEEAKNKDKEATKVDDTDKPDDKVSGEQLKTANEQIAAMRKELEGFKAKEQEEAEKKKTTEQKLAESSAAVAKLERKTLVLELSLAKGLTDTDLIERVRGDSADDINADIDKLLDKFKVNSHTTDKKTPGNAATPPKQGEDVETKSNPNDPYDYMAFRNQALKAQ